MVKLTKEELKYLRLQTETLKKTNKFLRMQIATAKPVRIQF
jgi:hypothetical protein